MYDMLPVRTSDPQVKCNYAEQTKQLYWKTELIAPKILFREDLHFVQKYPPMPHA